MNFYHVTIVYQRQTKVSKTKGGGTRVFGNHAEEVIEDFFVVSCSRI
jgi:hypothetical protein